MPCDDLVLARWTLAKGLLEQCLTPGDIQLIRGLDRERTADRAVPSNTQGSSLSEEDSTGILLQWTESALHLEQ
ncbi:hypothetical protein QC763_0001220 [Podospora pseudopauciseta]|uniref:Uncharacterized protein n=1 Tax=Podospora pseudopauciseta TaxID=2093780 RepID=A0ABR0HVN5_9PEZI|nr:hypothetical protein QC763_0001220 [Podospora pseudopauciseta]